MQSSLRILPVVAAATVAALVGVSCSDTCSENRNALPRAGFYTDGDVSVTIDSLEVVGVGMKGDSALSSVSVQKSELYLPFRIDSDTTAYVFINARQGAGQRDTVRFVYTRTPRFVSAECGVSYIFEMKQITWTGPLIDSVVCPQGYIDNVNAENLRIYFATSADQP